MYYDEGWNDYIAGKECKGNTIDYLDGWKDCKQATEKYGKQNKI